MPLSLARRAAPALIATVACVLIGCGSDVTATPPPAGPTITVSGTVQAGALPISAASVQIYAAGTAGNRSSPTALLATPLTTTSTGAFTTTITCPASTSLIYVVATGGAAGANAANSGSVLMSSPGICSNLTTPVSVALNEATTAASAYAFAQFLGPGAKLGASASNASGLALAAGTLANIVNITTGAAPGAGFPSNGVTPTPKLNLLASLINACITKAGANCAQLYNDATPPGSPTPANTLDAILNLVQHPALNVAALYTLAESLNTSIYKPLPATTPSDWMLSINLTGGGMASPASLGIDSRGRVWIANFQGIASLFTNTGAAVFASGITAPGLLESYGGAVDASDNFWIANEQGGPGNLGTFTVLNSAGQPVSGSPFAPAGINFPEAVAIDTNTNVWVPDYGDSRVSLLSSSGASLSGSGFASVQIQFPEAIAIDTQHNAWVPNSSASTVTRVSADGSTFTSFIVGNGPAGVAIDAANNVWVANYYGDSIGLVTSAGTVASGANGISGGGIVHPRGLAVDSAGSLWIANYNGHSLSELAAATSATPGAVLSPPTGWGADANLIQPYAIAIDQAGNLWVTSIGSNTLTEYIGIAAPVKTPTLGPPQAP